MPKMNKWKLSAMKVLLEKNEINTSESIKLNEWKINILESTMKTEWKIIVCGKH